MISREKKRNGSGGGGVLCIRNTVNYKRIAHQENDLEFLCIQISKPKVKPFLAGTWYRPHAPGSTIETIPKFECILKELEN